jgi:large subunit ribosomal protein L30
MPQNLKITLKRSVIGEKPNLRSTVRSLGLKRVGQSVVREDNSQNRGYVHTVRHLVNVEEVDA